MLFLEVIMKMLRNALSFLLMFGIAIPQTSVAGIGKDLKETFYYYFDLNSPITSRYLHINEDIQEIKRQELPKDILDFDTVAVLKAQSPDFKNRYAHILAFKKALKAQGYTDERVLETIRQNRERNTDFLICNFYYKLEKVYGHTQLDQNWFNANTQLCNAIRGQIGIPQHEVIFYPVGTNKKRLPNGAAVYGINNIPLSVQGRLKRKVVLIDVARFNQLSGAQKKDHLSHVLASFVQDDIQWNLLQKDNRIRMIKLLKYAPYITAMCIMGYWAYNGVPVPSDIMSFCSSAGSWVGSWFHAAPVVEVVPEVTVQGMAAQSGYLEWMSSCVYGEVQKVDPEMAQEIAKDPETWMQTIRDLVSSIYSSIQSSTEALPSWVGKPATLWATWKSAGLVSKVNGKVANFYNRLFTTLESYRADKIVCKKRGKDGMAGVYDRVARNIHDNKEGMTRLWYLWLQKKLGRI